MRIAGTHFAVNRNSRVETIPTGHQSADRLILAMKATSIQQAFRIAIWPIFKIQFTKKTQAYSENLHRFWPIIWPMFPLGRVASVHVSSRAPMKGARHPSSSATRGDSHFALHPEWKSRLVNRLLMGFEPILRASFAQISTLAFIGAVRSGSHEHRRVDSREQNPRNSTWKLLPPENSDWPARDLVMLKERLTSE